MRYISDPVVIATPCFQALLPSVASKRVALHCFALPRLMEGTIRVGKSAHVAQTELRPFVTSERLLCNLLRAEAW